MVDTSIIYDSIEKIRNEEGVNIQKSFHLQPFYCQLCETKHSAGTDLLLLSGGVILIVGVMILRKESKNNPSTSSIHKDNNDLDNYN